MSGMVCSSCGAPVEVANRFSKVVVCEYCGTHLKMSDSGLDVSGKYAKLAEFPSIFSIGCTGTILGKHFSVLGRMRYRYDGGFFDEWFIDYDGDQSWLAEDEGTYTLYTENNSCMDFPDMSSLRAGMSTIFDGKKVMIKEMGSAEVEGGEGELSYYVEPGTRISYIDGVSEGKKISIEYTASEMEIFSGRPLLKRDIQVKG